MSQRSVDVVREHVEAFLAQDTPRAVSYLDPHLVWDASRTEGVIADVSYGIEPLLEYVRRYRGAFDGLDWKQQQLVDLGAGIVLAVITETALGRTSGVPVNRSYAALYSVIEGKIVRITVFPSEEAAREAVDAR